MPPKNISKKRPVIVLCLPCNFVKHCIIRQKMSFDNTLGDLFTLHTLIIYIYVYYDFYLELISICSFRVSPSEVFMVIVALEEAPVAKAFGTCIEKAHSFVAPGRIFV